MPIAQSFYKCSSAVWHFGVTAYHHLLNIRKGGMIGFDHTKGEFFDMREFIAVGGLVI